MVGTSVMVDAARDPEMRVHSAQEEAKSLFGEMLDGPGPTMEEMEAFQLFESNDEALATWRLEHPSLEGSAASTSTLIIVRPTQPRSFSDDVPVQSFPKVVQVRPRAEPRRQSTSDLPTLATTRTKDSSATQDSRKRSPSPFRDFIRGRRRSDMSIELPPSPPNPHANPSQVIVVQDLRPAPRKLRKSRVTPELRVQTPPQTGSPTRSPMWSPIFTGEPETSSPIADRPSGARRRSWRTSLSGFSNHSGSPSTSPSTEFSPASAIRPPSPLAAFPSAARREGALPAVEKTKVSRPKRGSGNSSDSYHGDAEGDSTSKHNRTPSSDGSPPSPASTRNGKWKALKLGFGGGGGGGSGKKYTRSDSGKSDTSSWEWVSDSGGGPRSPVSPTFEVFRRPRRPSFSRSKSAASVESTSSSHLMVPSTSDIGALGSASTSSPNLTKIDETIEPAASVRLRPPRLAFAAVASAPPTLEDLTPKASPTLQLTSMDFAASKGSNPSRPRSIVASLLTQTRPNETAEDEIHITSSAGDASVSGDEHSDAQYQLPRSPALSNLGPGTPTVVSRPERTRLTRPSDSDLSFDTNDSILERDDDDETPASSALEDERDSETEEEEESVAACGTEGTGSETMVAAQETT